jgi:hypothetical protein
MKRTPHKKASRNIFPECRSLSGSSRRLSRERRILPGPAQALLAVASVCLSLYLPSLFDLLPGNLPVFSSALRQDSVYLLTTRGMAAVCLVALLFAARRGRRDSELAAQARSAGLVLSRRSVSGPRSAARKQLPAVRDLMIIGATGRSFSQDEGALAVAVRECREARILLLDPREHGALARSQGIPDPEISLDTINHQLTASIEFLRGLRSADRTILLKLYPDMPLFKMTIMNGFASVRHYHPGLNVRLMPEFVFRDTGSHGGMYLPLYRYFMSRWQDPDIPEYDFGSDELVYHDQLGAEVLREPFCSMVTMDPGSEVGEGDSRRSYIFRSDDIEDERKGERLIPSER